MTTLFSIARLSAPLPPIRHTARPVATVERIRLQSTVIRYTTAAVLTRYTGFPVICLPHFPAHARGLMGADGSFLMGADGTILQGAAA